MAFLLLLSLYLVIVLSSQKTVRLPDGTKLTFQAATYGSENWVIRESSLSRRIYEWRNRKAYSWRMGPIHLGHPRRIVFHSETNTLVLWFEADTKSEKIQFTDYLKDQFRLVLVDSTGATVTNKVNAMLFTKVRHPTLALYSFLSEIPNPVAARLIRFASADQSALLIQEIPLRLNQLSPSPQ